MQKQYGCDGVCKKLEMRISEKGGLSRLKKFEGGSAVLNQRKLDRLALEEELRKHVERQHRGRKFPILSKLRELKELAENGDENGIDSTSLSEAHLLNKREIGEIDQACQMMINTNELSRRVGLICVKADEPQPPDFTTMRSAGEIANDVRPWDVRVQDVLWQELMAEKTAVEEEQAEAREEEKATQEEEKEKERDAYSQYGIDFDWVGVARGTTELGETLKNQWDSGKSIGMMWVDGGDKSWGLDVLLGFQRNSSGKFQVVTHELRPRRDSRGWSLDSVFVSKKHGVAENQHQVQSAAIVARYWDSKSVVRVRGLEWCGRLILEPFTWESVMSDAKGKYVTLPLDQRLEIRDTYRPSVVFHSFGMSVTKEEVREDAVPAS